MALVVIALAGPAIEREDREPLTSVVSIVVDDTSAADKEWASWGAVADGVDLARDVTNLPPNVLNPETYAKKIEGLAEFGLEIEILDEVHMTELGMGALLGVGQGSEFESKIAIMKWNGGKDGDDPLLFDAAPFAVTWRNGEPGHGGRAYAVNASSLALVYEW